MAHAEMCPVCEGSGTVGVGTLNEVRTCNGCGGSGWITVQDPFPCIPIANRKKPKSPKWEAGK